MTLTAAEFQKPRTYTPQEVENIAFYQKAPMSNLVAVPKPAPQTPAAQAEIPQAVRKAITRKLQKLGKEYAVAVSGELKWETWDHEIRVYCRSTESVVLAMNFDPVGDQVTYANLAGLRLEEDSAPTPERFESHAVEFHQRAFGFPLPAERAVDDRIRLERFTGANTSHWRVIVNGATMLREASIRAEQDPRNGSWTLSGSRGPTPSEVKAIEELLQKEPTKITEQEAMAIAWKNWKAVGKTLEEGVSDYRIHCQLKEGSPAEMEPWEALPAHHYDAKAWKNTAARSEPTDPVFYEVQIARNLSIASVLVDRINGKVIRIQQGRIGW